MLVICVLVVSYDGSGYFSWGGGVVIMLCEDIWVEIEFY